MLAALVAAPVAPGVPTPTGGPVPAPTTAKLSLPQSEMLCHGVVRGIDAHLPRADLEVGHPGPLLPIASQRQQQFLTNPHNLGVVPPPRVEEQARDIPIAMAGDQIVIDVNARTAAAAAPAKDTGSFGFEAIAPDGAKQGYVCARVCAWFLRALLALWFAFAI